MTKDFSSDTCAASTPERSAKLETGFTPGPWEARDRYVFKGRDCIGICDTDNLPRTAMVANARMMAAAPTMAEYVRKRAAAGDEEAAAIWELANGHV